MDGGGVHRSLLVLFVLVVLVVPFVFFLFVVVFVVVFVVPFDLLPLGPSTSINIVQQIRIRHKA